MPWFEKLLKKSSPEPAKPLPQRGMERIVAEMQEKPGDCNKFTDLLDHLANYQKLIPDTTIAEIGAFQQQLWQVHQPHCHTPHTFLVFDIAKENSSILRDSVVLDQNELAISIAAVLQK